MIKVFKPEQYGGGTFGVALFELDHQSWYCGALLPRRIRKDLDFGTNIEKARICAATWNSCVWRYFLRDANNDVIGGTDLYDDACEFARAIVGSSRALTDDQKHRMSVVRVHDRDNDGQSVFDATIPN